MMRSLLFALAIAGCSSGGDEPPRCPYGDPTQPMALELFHLDEADNLVTTQPDARVPMRIPPKRGWALVLGVRATNLPVPVIDGLVRDLCDDSI